MSWLLIAGAVSAVCLAAWALFAPERPDSTGEAASRNKPEREPPP